MEERWMDRLFILCTVALTNRGIVLTTGRKTSREAGRLTDKLTIFKHMAPFRIFKRLLIRSQVLGWDEESTAFGGLQIILNLLTELTTLD